MPMAPQQPPPARPALPGRPPGYSPGPAGPARESEQPGCACPPGRDRPLPDPAAVRLIRVPESAPPYDVPGCSGPAAPAGAATGHTAEGGHAAGADGGSQDGRGTASPRIGQERRDRRTVGSPGGGRGDGTGPGQQPPGWPGQFAQVLAETLAGTRPARQIRPWTTERARTHIQRLGAQMSGGQQPRIRRVITSRPACNVVEMTVIVGFGTRVRALAVRLEHADATLIPGRPPRSARWVCTAVEAA